MNISAGVSEIRFGSAAEKFYLWPIYAAGRVENVRGIARRTEGDGIYLKPSEEERERILAMSRDRRFAEYSHNGVVSRSSRSIQPGALFDAIV